MAGKLLLMNPRKKAKKATAKKTVTVPRKKRRAKPSVKRAVKSVRRRATKVVKSVKRARKYSAKKFSGKLSIQDAAVAAAIGAGGALMSNVLVNIVMKQVGDKVPAGLQTGAGKAVLKGGLIFGAGMLAAKFLPKHKSKIAAAVQGAMTVIVYDLAHNMAIEAATQDGTSPVALLAGENVELSYPENYGWNPADVVGEFVTEPGMGEYYQM